MSVYQDAHFLVERREGIVCLVRTPSEFASAEAIVQAHENVLRFVRGEAGIVVDVRQVRGRNDASFETAHRDYRIRIADAVDRIAVLVRTTAGQLQAQRLAVADRTPRTHAFLDASAAFAYARYGHAVLKGA